MVQNYINNKIRAIIDIETLEGKNKNIRQGDDVATLIQKAVHESQTSPIVQKMISRIGEKCVPRVIEGSSRAGFEPQITSPQPKSSLEKINYKI